MYYIVGLGNPGEEYVNSRHNVAWQVLDVFVRALSLPHPHMSARFSGAVSEGMVGNEDVTVLYPSTYMNLSGSAVVKLVAKADAEHLIVLYDDIDLALGDIKISFGKGAGGHNGVQSVIDALQTKEFIRVRIGIAEKTVWPWEKGTVRRPKGKNLAKFVLASFKSHEKTVVEKIAETCSDILLCIVAEGKERAMERFNT